MAGFQVQLIISCHVILYWKHVFIFSFKMAIFWHLFLLFLTFFDASFLKNLMGPLRWWESLWQCSQLEIRLSSVNHFTKTFHQFVCLSISPMILERKLCVNILLCCLTIQPIFISPCKIYRKIFRVIRKTM